jgi:vacuolar-type H+-ATPase subunit I/STV1
MKDRLKRICDSFHGESYELPTTKEEVEERLGKTKLYLDNLYNTLKLTIDNFKQYLVQIQHAQNADGFSLLKVYKLYLRKNKNIYRTMNKFRFDGSLMIGLFWIPTKFAQNA